MSNRKKLELAIQTSRSRVLKNSLDYFLNDVEHDDDYDIVDAFEDVAERDFATAAVRSIWIAVGYAIPLRFGQSIVGDDRPLFHRKGVKYYPVEAWDQWVIQ